MGQELLTAAKDIAEDAERQLVLADLETIPHQPATGSPSGNPARCW